MRGTNVTEWQLRAAEKFLRDRNMNVAKPENYDRKVSLPFGDLVRLVAWYGQIRAKAVERGHSADEPGETYTVDSTKPGERGSIKP